jgi:hypothetical protein
MRLDLDLSKHCIQTELKRQYHRALAAYFHGDAKDRTQIEQIIEMTQQALSRLDFGHLRGAYPQLDGGTRAAVRFEERHRNVDIIIDGTKIGSFGIKREDR